MQAVCQISNEPAADLVVKNSRLLPSQQLWVKKTYWEQEYEPRWVVILYGQMLIKESIENGDGTAKMLSQDERFQKILRKHLYFGKPITMRELLV